MECATQPRQFASAYSRSAYGGRVRLVYLDAPYQEIMRRNQQRKERVPEQVIHRFICKMELPDRTEAPVVEWICQ